MDTKNLAYDRQDYYDGIDPNAQCVPLMDSQKGIYIQCMNAPEGLMYNLPMALQFPISDINLQKLVNSLKTVICNYAAFSIKITMIDAQPYMEKMENTDANIEIISSNESDISKIKEEFVRPFDITKGPLYRFKIITTPDSLYLLIDMHHIIFDGFSIGVFERVLNAAYLGEELPAEDENLFVLSQLEKKWESSDQLKQTYDYFERMLSGVEVDSNLPIDTPDAEPNNKCSHVTLCIPIDVSDIEQFTGKLGVSEASLFLAAFTYTLSKFTAGDDECLFNAISNGRYNKKTRKTIGMLARTLPVYSKLDENEGVREFLQKTQSNFYETMKHEEVSFGKLVHEFGIRSDVIFVYQAKTMNQMKLGDTVSDLEMMKVDDALANFVAIMKKRDDCYELNLDYKKSMYHESSIDRFAKAFAKVIEGFMTCDKLCEINFTDYMDIEKIEKFNATDVPLDSTKSMVDLLREQVGKTPDQTAIVYQDIKYTYKEYDELTDKIAGKLHNMGVGCGDVVSIILPRCQFMPIAAIGALKAGAAYQPLDPSYPQERLNFMIKDSSAKVLIADRELRPLLNEYDGQVLYTDEFDALQKTDSQIDLPGFEDAFILLYTSGTTGTPKGCVLEHRNLVSFSKFYIKKYKLDTTSRMSAYASFGFDANMMDTYPTLLCGATLYIIPEDMRLNLNEMDTYMTESGITHAFMTTQIGRQFSIHTKCPTMKEILMGGEKLVPFKPSDDIASNNIYGPTECTVFTNAFRIQNDDLLQPIGAPNDNTKLYVLDKYNRILPIGVPGELCISGSQVGRGYLNRPEQTAKVFTKNPYSDEPKYSRLYHTGDIVRWMDDGNIEFIGRRDGQVKIRGFRIELTEVERIIRDFPAIKDTTVIAKESPTGGKMLVAYIVSDEKVSVNELSDFIISKKPPYMVPAVTMQIDKIPLNVNSKVDKRKLPEPPKAQSNKNEYVEPSNSYEEKICLAFEKVLHCGKVGIHDDFFALGADSILVAEAVIECGISGLEMNMIYTGKTPEKIAEIYLKSDKAPRPAICRWGSEYVEGKPVLIVVEGITSAEYSKAKIKEWSTMFNVMNFTPLDEYEKVLRDNDFMDDVIDLDNELLMYHLPEGAVVFGYIGFCAGGTMAYQMAAKYVEKTGNRPNVYLCDSNAYNDEERKTNREKALEYDFDFYAKMDPYVPKFVLEKQMIYFAVDDLKPYPKYDGKVTLFTQKDFSGLEQKISNWKNYAKNLTVVPLDGNHFDITCADTFLSVYSEQMRKDALEKQKNKLEEE